MAGRTSGLCELNDTIAWEAIHLGVKQRLTTRITSMNPPVSFEDRIVKGAFKSFCHQHIFEETDEGTIMKDVFEFESPLGFLGHLANRIFLTQYMTRLLAIRNQTIKMVAEGS